MGGFDDALEAVHDDFNNVRAAWLYQADRLNVAELRRLMDGLWLYFDSYSRGQEGIEIFEPLLQVFEIREDKNGRLFYGQLLARYAWCNNDVGDHQTASNLFHQALEIFQSFGATSDILFAYRALFWGYRFAGNYTQSLSYAQRGLDLAQAIDSPESIAIFSIMVGGSYIVFERYDEALELIESQPDCPFKLFVLPYLLIKLEEYTRAEAIILAELEKPKYHRTGYMFRFRDLAMCALQRQDYEKSLEYVIKGLQYVDAPGYAWGSHGYVDVCCATTEC